MRYRNHQSGDVGMARAMVWLTEQGYEVYLPVGEHAVADIVAIRGNRTRRFDVKVGKANKDGTPKKSRKLTARQQEAGVELLWVTPEGVQV